MSGFQNLRVGLVGPLPPPAGGMAGQTRQLAELLTREGAQVTMVPTNAPYRPAVVGRIPVLRAAFRLLPYLVALWRAAGRSDVFHVMANSGWSWHLFGAPAVWVAHLRRVPVVVNYRGGEAEAFLQRAGALVSFTMRRATRLAVPSGFLERVFARHGMTAEVVPNVVDLQRFQPRPPRPSNEARRDAAFHLVVARNLEALYDNATALRAFARVRATYAQARLSVAGSGPEEHALKQLARELRIDDAVHFTGKLDRDAMAALYRDADLLLNPSLADNMPNSLLEAMASGVPIVSTNVGGIPFMVRDGFTALLVSAGDDDAMAQRALQLLGDAAQWHQLSQTGLIEVQRYTWGQVAPLLAALYAAPPRERRLTARGA